MEVNGPEISNYGVVIKGQKEGKVVGLVEKPSFETKPSNLASIGRYVLDSKIFKVLHKTGPGSGGEIQLADAITKLAEKSEVQSIRFSGNLFDCGSLDGFMNASKFEYNRRLKLRD